MKLRCALLACFLALPPQVASTAQAQILNLDTAPKGPTLPKDCATTALAAALTKEAEQLEQAMLQQTGHERLASEAGAVQAGSVFGASLLFAGTAGTSVYLLY